MYDIRRFGCPTFKKSEATFFKIIFRHEKKTSSKKNFLSNILFMKYSDLNFYWNRSSRTWFARAIWSHAKRSKMSPGMSCSNGADHILFKKYRKKIFFRVEKNLKKSVSLFRYRYFFRSPKKSQKSTFFSEKIMIFAQENQKVQLFGQ